MLPQFRHLGTHRGDLLPLSHDHRFVQLAPPDSCDPATVVMLLKGVAGLKILDGVILEGRLDVRDAAPRLPTPDVHVHRRLGHIGLRDREFHIPAFTWPQTNPLETAQLA